MKKIFEVISEYKLDILCYILIFYLFAIAFDLI